jgi:hypothetical protein
MLKYAKVINEETKACEVGLGTNSTFYQSIGMTEMDVEQAYDGGWYVLGFAPEKPEPTEEELKQARISELQQYLSETDWYAIRESETGVDIPAEVKKARADARAEISSLRGDEEPLVEPVTEPIEEPEVVELSEASEEPVVELYSMEI